MRISIVLFAGFLYGTSIFAQDPVKDTTWKAGGVISVNFTQAYYDHWQAGGIPSISGVSFLKLFATYQKNKWRWNNQLDLGYGLIRERQALTKKTDDRINFDSKLGRDIGKQWFVTFLGSFRTQFTPAYEDPDLQVVKISDFLSPAYLIASLGFDHNPNENFSLFIAPISLKSTFVKDQNLANNGAYGVKAGEWETIVRDSGSVDSVYVSGKTFRYEIGAHLKMNYKVKLVENVEFITRLELYANYIDNPGNIDVNWEGLINMKVNNFLSANIRCELIYDDDIKVPLGQDLAGNDISGPRMQVKELFGLGLSYTF